MDPYHPDHYRVLGVSTRADTNGLKASYRKLSRVYHPDRQSGSALATSRFQLISAAYATLSDAAERERYDRLLLLTDPLRFVHDPRADRALAVLDGVVKRLRNRRKELPGGERGRNVRVRASLSFRQAALGGQIDVPVEFTATCSACDGGGTTEPERNPACHVCAGAGKLKVGVRRNMRSCAFCVGKGYVLLAPCGDCDGEGLITRTRQEAVVVKARCRTGVVIRVRGRGEAADGGADRGDLLVDVHVQPDPLFEEEGDDIVVALPLTWSEAALGASLDVPTLHGGRRLRVPPKTPSGREIRVKGAGLARRSGGHGDLRYRIEIDTPTDLRPVEQKGLADFEASLGPARFPRRRSFDAHVRELSEARGTLPPSWSARGDDP